MEGGGPVPVAIDDLDIPDDSLKVIVPPSDTGFVYYRTMATVRFKSTASADQILGFLTKYRAAIVGGTQWAGSYIVRYPDPGSTWSDVTQFISRMRAESFVLSAGSTIRSGGVVVDGRFPSDGPGLARADWFGTGDTSWGWSVGQQSPAGSPIPVPLAGGKPGQRVDTSGNSSRPGCPDRLPPVPSYVQPTDSLFLVQGAPDTTFVYYRRFLIVKFKPGTLPTQLCGFLTRHRASIASGIPLTGAYVLRFADPGSSFATFKALGDSLEHEAIVQYVAPISRREKRATLDQF